MSAFNIDEVWPDDSPPDPPPRPPAEDVEVVSPIRTVAARVQGIAHHDEVAAMRALLTEMEVAFVERLTTMAIVMLACLTALFIQLDRVRRELRFHQGGLRRPR